MSASLSRAGFSNDRPKCREKSASVRSSCSPSGRRASRRGGGPNRREWRARWDDLVTALFSISTLGESVFTVLDPAGRSAMRPDGFNTGGDFVAAVRAEGQYALYVDKERDKLAALLPWSRTQAFDLAPLADMLEAAAPHGARVVVVMTPEQAEGMELYRALGARATFDAWRA